jgi:PPOX class probable F420-dependent enzyme
MDEHRFGTYAPLSVLEARTAMEIPESARDLVSFDKRAFAVLATIMPDGRPQATPVWFDVRDGNFEVNTARGRIKDINMNQRSDVALAILDPDDEYRYLQVRGSVVSQTERGAREHLDHLALKYHGVERYPGSTEGQTRVVYTIKPRAFFTNR